MKVENEDIFVHVAANEAIGGIADSQLTRHSQRELDVATQSATGKSERHSQL